MGSRGSNSTNMCCSSEFQSKRIIEGLYETIVRISVIVNLPYDFNSLDSDLTFIDSRTERCSALGLFLCM
jgi:hypothetical protein